MSMKRKAAAGALATASPASKRSRRTGDTSEEVTRKGLEILEALRDSKDKHGRSVAARFEKLPDKKKEAAWYEQVTLPLSLQMIEDKLQQGSYSSMTALESDLLRLVINWKDVYDRSSESHKEAEKVRKIVTTYMKDQLLNPQYQLDPNYVPAPTPAPDVKEEDNEEAVGNGIQTDTDTKGDRPRGRIILRRSIQATAAAAPPIPPSAQQEPEESSKPPRLRLRAPRRSDGPASENVAEEEATETPPPAKRGRLILRRSSIPAAEPEPEPEPKKPHPTGSSMKMPATSSEGFEGKTMSQAQDKIITELFELEDADGNSISGPFVNLPSRELKDYYAAVKQPLSLKGAQKLVRGVKGRDKPTGITLLETWQEFEDEVSRIWNNARIYNEDESDICKLAGQLEKYFRLRVEEAKKVVADPVKPKLKLHVSKTSEPPGSVEADANHGVPSGPMEQPARFTVDEEALRRQRQLVANGVVGKLESTETSRIALPQSIGGIPTNMTASTGSSTFPLTNGIAHPEMSMLPPSSIPRLQSAMTRPPPSPASEETKRPWDAWKRADRPESFRWPYTTIKEILLISHPSLDLGEKAYRWSLYPWKEFNYASDTIPMRTDTTRILLSPLLVKPTRERPVVYHHVTLNGVRLQASSSAPRISGGQASEEDNLYRPVFDIQLNADDVNEIMVECYTCPSEICETKDVLFDKHLINIQPR